MSKTYVIDPKKKYAANCVLNKTLASERSHNISLRVTHLYIDNINTENIVQNKQLIFQIKRENKNAA